MATMPLQIWWARRREQLEGIPVASLIKSDESSAERALDGDSTYVETWATIKNKKYFLEYRPSPIYDSKGNITGAIEAIIDLTGQKLSLQAVQELIGKARDGDLSARAKVEAEGDYKLLVDGINEMLDDFINPLRLAADYIDRICKGDIPEKITDEYNGDFNNIKNNLNNCIDEMGVLVDDVGVVIKAAGEGNLATGPIRTGAKGDFRKVVQGVNDTLDAVIGPLNVAADYVDQISKGEIPEKITDSYDGDFNTIKDNLNRCIDAVNRLVADAGALAQAAVEGRLATRADASRHEGDFRKIVEGVNQTLDAVIGPLNVAADYVDQISKGDIPSKITDSYDGDFNTIKNNLNTLHRRGQPAGGRRRRPGRGGGGRAGSPPAPTPPSTRATSARSSRASTRPSTRCWRRSTRRPRCWRSWPARPATPG